MKPTVVFPDPMLAAVEILRDRLPAHEAGVSVGTKTPEALGAAFPGLPYVMVRLDGTTTTYPVAETATLRVSVWGDSEASGLALAQVARAVLLAYEGGAKVRSFGDLTGPSPTDDPDTGNPLSTFTVAARLRPSTL